MLANGRTSSRLTEAANNGTLVLDTSVAVLQTAGTLSLSAPGAFGQIINRGLIDLEGIGATFITGTLVNAGTITLPNNGLFQSFGSFINTGTIALAGGADLNLFGDFSNTGTVSISTGSTLDLHQLPASLGAVTVAAGGTVILHGNVALANLPAVSGQGQLSIAGTLDLGGGTLVPGAAGLPPNIAIGTVRNGTLVVDGSLNQLTVTALDGITIAGTLRQPTGSITVINGLTASNGAATIDLRSGGSNPFDNFIFADTEALNNVTVLLESPIFTFGESSAGNTLTLGPNTALVQTGQAGALTGQTDQIGANGTLRNLGAINLASAGFTHLTGQAFINAGSVMVGPAAQLVIDAGTFVNSGTITIAAGGAFDLATFAFLADLGSITNAGTLLIDATGTLDLNGATLDLSATPNFVVNGTLQNGTLVTQASNYTQGPNATLTNVTVLACFAEGTKILTTTGERSVETLRIGDLVPTFTTRTIRRIAWIGDFLHPTPPIRIRAHAFAPNTPHTDLRLSPDHAVYRNGALIPVHLLANPMTIHAETIATKTRYIHLQLDQHDTILANGLATESYLDTTHRAAWDNRACAPLLLGGEAVKALRKPSSKNFRTLPWSSLRLYS